jgi:hypothetical protein
MTAATLEKKTSARVTGGDGGRKADKIGTHKDRDHGRAPVSGS